MRKLSSYTLHATALFLMGCQPESELPLDFQDHLWTTAFPIALHLASCLARSAAASRNGRSVPK